ncbi:MAG: hypothetical protein QW453_07300 [Thermoprotei archaeon]
MTRVYGVFRASLSVVFDAPLRFVYGWCTDFSEEDVEIAGWKSRRHILEKTKHRCVWISHYTLGQTQLEGVRIVTMNPPLSWHLDGLGDDLDEFGDYQLVPLGPRKTRLRMKFKVLFKDPRAVESKEHWLNGMRDDWAKFKAALEKEYSEGKKHNKPKV